MNQGNPAKELLIEKRGVAIIVTLNRPRALNALSIGMIKGLLSGLDEWERDESVAAIMIRGAGGKAFCAGGDVKEFHRVGREEPQEALRYFAHEYTLDRRLFHYPKPVVAFMNGITMGGGYGIAGNSRIRVATDYTVFAMPETKIGFFPDVGSVYHLAKCPDHVGWYLALTGNSIGSADMLAAGLADVFIPLAQEEEMIAELAQGGSLREMRGTPPDEPILKTHTGFINRVFGRENAVEIVEDIEKEENNFSRETLSAIRARSPMSVMIAAEQMRRSRGASFDAVIETDFQLVQKFLKGPDMYEGIRAVILDKDNKPRWSPARIEDISENAVKEYFTHGEYNLNDIHISTA